MIPAGILAANCEQISDITFMHFVSSESGDEIELPPEVVTASGTLRAAVEHAADGERFVFALAFPTRICKLAAGATAAASASGFLLEHVLSVTELLQLASCSIFLDVELLQKAVCCRVADALGQHESPWSIREAFGIAADGAFREPSCSNVPPLAPMRSLSLSTEAARLDEDAVKMVLRECDPRTLSLLSDVSAPWREAVQQAWRSDDFRERGWTPLAVVIDATAETMSATVISAGALAMAYPPLVPRWESSKPAREKSFKSLLTYEEMIEKTLGK